MNPCFYRPLHFEPHVLHRGLSSADPPALNSLGWPWTMYVGLRFRRLYFDGKLAGRFEYGFIIEQDVEDRVSRNVNGFAYDIGRLSTEIQAISLIVRSMDDAQKPATVGTCAEALGLAYTMATTRQSAPLEFPPAETYGKAVVIGPPLIHMRVSDGKAVKPSRDRRELEGAGGKLFITSTERAPIRNNVVVQLSDGHVMNESAQERAVRVIFSHMNALLFAQSHFLRVTKELKLGTRSALGGAVKDMLARFDRLGPSGPMAANDKEFAAAIKMFAAAYAGRSEELVSRIEELATQLAQPSTASTIGAAVKNSLQWLIELVVKTGVQTSVQAAMKGS